MTVNPTNISSPKNEPESQTKPMLIHIKSTPNALKDQQAPSRVPQDTKVYHTFKLSPRQE